MYSGEIPSAIREFRVGVIPRFRKSARNPSSDIRIVVGRNCEEPFDTKDNGCDVDPV